MPKPTRRRRSVAALALVGAIAAVLSFGTAAHAASVVDIDPDATATLNVHKFVQPDRAGAPGDGRPEDTSGLTPLADVEFTVERVAGIDLRTNEGWQEATRLSAEDAAARVERPGRTAVTDAAGDAVFDVLPLGLYLVTETRAPAGVTRAAPFLVTLPLTDAERRDTWRYDVHVYPKNAVTGAEKSVTDGSAVVEGDDIVYTIEADIPRVEIIDGYKIVDTLDDRLAHAGTTVELTDGTAIAQPGDYTVVFDEAANAVTVEFTEAGRAVLAGRAGEARVLVTVTARATATGVIENEAVIYPNRPSFDVRPGEPGGPIVTPPVATKWGALVVEKVDAVDPARTLAGAVFRLHLSEDDARAGRDPLVVRGVSEFTTGDDGRIVVEGLRYSDFADGEQLDPGDPRWRSYWLVETRAPAGYELLAAPVRVEVTSHDPAVVTITVANAPHDAGFRLPATGLAGTAAIVAGGVLLLGGALALAVARRRRRHA
ncbi:SpaH/EbpB family LPXTG-anchored major pilin [Agromyces mediolanus]|uniref:SpaH/EbpB family LPXTG-anchored major pilin n=1 Tax=Agromyces mediolanus TaxID=41986 RepID=UPI00203F29E9|nr:SpaH/EbpB family LPXTG-anchored major pilin [Agromyces mediolanus]MCM3657218.1 SpaH/EbpB family LPXTG-anchored major pilin [Agromyces mediolanus]